MFVRSRKAPFTLVNQAVEEFGDLHILVNNAGVLRDKMSFNMEESDWDTVIAVHLKGHFAPSRHAAVYWRNQAKAGNEAPRRIINTSSEAGLFANAGQANYAAAKSGLTGLTKTIARELGGKGITCNVVAPGFIETDMTDDSSVQRALAAVGERIVMEGAVAR